MKVNLLKKFFFFSRLCNRMTFLDSVFFLDHVNYGFLAPIKNCFARLFNLGVPQGAAPRPVIFCEI
jgi:hypothetical protein